MEYTQWDRTGVRNWGRLVLILVVMEYTQWESMNEWKTKTESLNPCCNGIYSMRKQKLKSLSSEIPVLILVVMEYTQWVLLKSTLWKRHVLILVVMEYTQWVLTRLEGQRWCVLILVVMEYTQWDLPNIRNAISSKVLILVVMEYTQWVGTWIVWKP